jgi:negative regulator of flagellin synthesis FlgM
VASKISGVDTSAQIASIGAGRAVQLAKDVASGSAQTASDAPDDSQDVQITGTARQLADLEQQLRDLPAVNETRVSQIRTAIEQGTYAVHPEQIADQLMSLEKALGQLPNGSPSQDSSEPGSPE